MFHIIKNSLISIAKEGIISHISFFHKKKDVTICLILKFQIKKM